MNGTELASVKRIPPPDGDLAAPMLAGPRELYRQATDVAGICREIVLRTSKRIGNRDHVAVEGWQAIATTHGCMLSIDEVKEDEAGNVTSIASVRRMADGVVLSRAEGFVGMDEKTWASRQRYARRAMSQTRAMSRVARAAFAHVVVLIDANLATTPAEEMPGTDDEPAPRRPAPRQAPAPTLPFAEAFARAVMNRGFAKETGDTFLQKWLDHRKVTLDKVSVAHREQLVAQVADGAVDTWLRGIEMPGGPPDAEQVTEQPEGGAASGGRSDITRESDEASSPGPKTVTAPPPVNPDTPPGVGIDRGVLIDTLVKNANYGEGASQDDAAKAVDGWLRLNSPGGDPRNLPPHLWGESQRDIASGRAYVTKTGVLRFHALK